MIVEVGLIYSDLGYIDKAIWWERENRPNVIGPFKIVEACIVDTAGPGQKLYCVATTNKRGSTEAIDVVNRTTVKLLETIHSAMVYRREADAYRNMMQYITQRVDNIRIIPILYYDNSQTVIENNCDPEMKDAYTMQAELSRIKQNALQLKATGTVMVPGFHQQLLTDILDSVHRLEIYVRSKVQN